MERRTDCGSRKLLTAPVRLHRITLDTTVGRIGIRPRLVPSGVLAAGDVGRGGIRLELQRIDENVFHAARHLLQTTHSFDTRREKVSWRRELDTAFGAPA